MKAASHLTARPLAAPVRRVESGLGLLRIDVGGERAAWARIDPSRDGPLPLALMLHGAGGEPAQALDLLEPFASEAGIAVVAPASADYTWDGVLHRPGRDVERIDRALQWLFERFAVDRRRVAIGGFSDGASFALSLGVDNGDLFSHVVALSPGFVAPSAPRGSARFFVSHGVHDRVLPIAHCSRRVVPTLRRTGLDVEYHEFDGGHEIPAAIARRAVDFLRR